MGRRLWILQQGTTTTPLQRSLVLSILAGGVLYLSRWLWRNQTTNKLNDSISWVELRVVAFVCVCVFYWQGFLQRAAMFNSWAGIYICVEAVLLQCKSYSRIATFELSLRSSSMHVQRKNELQSDKPLPRQPHWRHVRSCTSCHHEA